MRFVYLLESLASPAHRYVGSTDDLRRRLAEHDAAKSIHTAKFRPWRFVTFVAFRDAARAIAFEKYLKSGSGRAFARRHFWRQVDDRLAVPHSRGAVPRRPTE